MMFYNIFPVTYLLLLVQISNIASQCSVKFTSNGIDTPLNWDQALQNLTSIKKDLGPGSVLGSVVFEGATITECGLSGTGTSCTKHFGCSFQAAASELSVSVIDLTGWDADAVSLVPISACTLSVAMETLTDCTEKDQRLRLYIWVEDVNMKQPSFGGIQDTVTIAYPIPYGYNIQTFTVTDEDFSTTNIDVQLESPSEVFEIKMVGPPTTRPFSQTMQLISKKYSNIQQDLNVILRATDSSSDPNQLSNDYPLSILIDQEHSIPPIPEFTESAHIENVFFDDLTVGYNLVSIQMNNKNYENVSITLSDVGESKFSQYFTYLHDEDLITISVAELPLSKPNDQFATLLLTAVIQNGFISSPPATAVIIINFLEAETTTSPGIDSTTTTTSDGDSDSTTTTTSDGDSESTTTTTSDGDSDSTTTTTSDGDSDSTTTTTSDGDSESTTTTTSNDNSEPTTSSTPPNETPTTTNTPSDPNGTEPPQLKEPVNTQLRSAVIALSVIIALLLGTIGLLCYHFIYRQKRKRKPTLTTQAVNATHTNEQNNKEQATTKARKRSKTFSINDEESRIHREDIVENESVPNKVENQNTLYPNLNEHL